MRQSKVESKTFTIKAFCDCGGELLPTGQCYPTSPPRYPHECNLCFRCETLNDRYPLIKHEMVELSNEDMFKMAFPDAILRSKKDGGRWLCKVYENPESQTAWGRGAYSETLAWKFALDAYMEKITSAKRNPENRF